MGRPRKHPVLLEKECEFCKQPFCLKPKARRSQKFCSPKCHYASCHINEEEKKRIARFNKLEWMKVYNKQYNIDNKEKLTIKNKNYSKTIQAKYTAAQSKACRRDYDFDISMEQYVEIIKDGICHYCYDRLSETGSSLDRKDNSNGYFIENCVACCGPCNKTFMDIYSYPEKLILAKSIREIKALRKNQQQQPEYSYEEDGVLC